MYQEFFGLKEPPFNLTPDPRFLYLSKRHRDALAALVYGIRENKGFIALTGEIGAGKTTLCRAFLRDLNTETTNVALIVNSFLSDLELLQTINDELGIPSESDSKKILIDELNRYLIAENEKGKATILIIDEAQNLSPVVLEQIRMLSNLETETSKLIQIVLIGQPELGEILARPDLEQLNQRILVRCHIAPLNRQEIYHYIRHRLHVAGAEINLSVTPTALNRIFRFSGGVPRKINLLCDRALLAAYVAGTFQIDPKIIAVAEKELGALGEGARRTRWLRPAAVPPGVQVTLAAIVVVGFLAFLFAMGLWLSMPPQAAPDPGAARAAASPGPALPRPTPPLPPAPGLADLPDPASIRAPEDWTHDDDDVVRVSDTDFARVASILTLAKTWNYPFGLDPFRSYDKETILNLNLLRILSRQGIDLHSFETTSSLKAVVALDLPLLLDLGDGRYPLAQSVALLRVKDGVCSVADARLGVVEVGLDSLALIARRATVVYLDPDGLAALAPGETAESVARLRVFLARQGVWRGQATRTFNADVERAIARFQTRRKLPSSGRIDGPTAARIAAERQTFRPHLLR